MELKIKESYTDTEIWVGPNNSNMICKFIEEGLYPHLYKVYPHIFDTEEEVYDGKKSRQKLKEIFEVIEEIEILKNNTINDLSINDTTTEGNSPE